MAILRVIGGRDVGKIAEVREAAVTIGRGPECQLRVTDEHVSMIHALVEPFDEAWRVRDLESLGGTVVNGERTLDRRLMFGDIITVGETAILFGSGSESVKTEAVGSAESPFSNGSGTL